VTDLRPQHGLNYQNVRAMQTTKQPARKPRATSRGEGISAHCGPSTRDSYKCLQRSSSKSATASTRLMAPLSRVFKVNRGIARSTDYFYGGLHNNPSNRTGTSKRKTKNASREPRPTPTGLRPQHPEWGGTGGGNAAQAAPREQPESHERTQKRTHASPQAQRRLPQKLQLREQRRQ
jgi:hypothetical protein